MDFQGAIEGRREIELILYLLNLLDASLFWGSLTLHHLWRGAYYYLPWDQWTLIKTPVRLLPHPKYFIGSSYLNWVKHCPSSTSRIQFPGCDYHPPLWIFFPTTYKCIFDFLLGSWLLDVVQLRPHFSIFLLWLVLTPPPGMFFWHFSLLYSLVEALPTFQSWENSPPSRDLYQKGSSISLSEMLRALLSLMGLLSHRVYDHLRSYLTLSNEPWVLQGQGLCLSYLSLSPTD